MGVPYPKLSPSVAIAIYLWANYVTSHDVESLLDEAIEALDFYFLFAQRERSPLAYDGLICCVLYHSFLTRTQERLLTKETFFRKCSQESLTQMERIVTTPNWIAKTILLILDH